MATHPYKRLGLKPQAPQCGYCQSGQIMQAAALLGRKSQIQVEQRLTPKMNGILCAVDHICRVIKGLKLLLQLNQNTKD